jgi:drug/metabolite transporter (DMT)-like permease
MRYSFRMKNSLPVVFALATALCWGLYGPILGKARVADTSPFKPYVAIGVAYLVIAILGGLIGMWYQGDSFQVGAGGRWGVAAGALGALGAFTLTLAMFSGGARIPHTVMPIVFGGAVTVTAIYSLWTSREALRAGPWLWVGIVLMLVSVVMITMNTPHAAPPPPK